MDSPANVKISLDSNDELKMTGTTCDHETVNGAVKFQALVKVIPDGGRVIFNDSSLTVTGANSAVLFISIASNFINYHNISANAGERAENYLSKAVSKEYSQLLNDHISFYQKYFNRVSSDLGRQILLTIRLISGLNNLLKIMILNWQNCIFSLVDTF